MMSEETAAGTPGRIEKQITVHAPQSRVWRALTEASQFGAWFGARLAPGTFTPGARVRGPMTIPGHEHFTLDLTVERVEPERYLSYRWHPYADPALDLSAEPLTLVEFRLEAAGGGTRLTVVESGFDRLPGARRVSVFPLHESGWVQQLENVARHVTAG
ncbi:MAG: SRPBCC family protein [Anaeromyxobacter sp.]